MKRRQHRPRVSLATHFSGVLLALLVLLLSLGLLSLDLQNSLSLDAHSSKTGHQTSSRNATVAPTAQQAHSPSPRGPVRTLVIVTGSLRGGERAWQTLYDNVLDPSHADLAVITDEILPSHYRNTSLRQRANYWWTVPRFDDWADAMDLVHNSSAWRAPLLELYNPSNIMLGGMGKIPASGAIIFMFRWYLSRHLQEENLLAKYGKFVVTRSDHYYLCAHDVRRLHREYLWVPEGEDYRGINDRHFITGRKHILTALNILPPLLANPAAYWKQLANPTYNSERFLLHRWAQDGIMTRIRRVPRTLFTCATEKDTSRWSAIAEKPNAQGVHVKYPGEYAAALKGCHMAPPPLAVATTSKSSRG